MASCSTRPLLPPTPAGQQAGRAQTGHLPPSCRGSFLVHQAHNRGTAPTLRNTGRSPASSHKG